MLNIIDKHFDKNNYIKINIIITIQMLLLNTNYIVEITILK